MTEKLYNIHMGPAKCAIDLGDGSERGEYVNQDYILNKLGRPMRAISLMYCYYPLDKGWPGRASVVHASPDVSFAWDYPYDDYFTYKGGLGGNTEDEPFNYMREVRAHGQDVILTLTIDPKLDDERLIAIAKDLRKFGRMQLRINHEATGTWFSFNKRASYQEVADFFTHFAKIIKEYAPNVSTVLCVGGIEDPNATEIIMEKEFSQAVKATDIWSVDKYMALHWGWPYDVAEHGGTSHKRDTVENTYKLTKMSYNRFKEINGGVSKPMVMSEFNADGDVTGAYDQAEMVKDFCDMLKNDPEQWFTAFTFYQFRDKGRLGLEIEDPNYPDQGFEQPVMNTFKEIIHDDFFYPSITKGEETSFPKKLRWGGSEDAEGIAIPLHFEKNPVFCEINFDEDINLIFELNGKWFYKSPKVKTVDMMSAFFEKPLDSQCDLTLKMFCPPANGENIESQGADWQTNYYTEISKLPDIRVRFEPVEK